MDWRSIVDDLIVALTTESGESHLYASCTERYPNATSNHWNLGTTHSDVLRLSSQEGLAAGCDFPATLYLTVHSMNQTSFVIQTSSDAASSVPLLISGVVTTGDVKFGRFKYYQIRLAQDYVDVNVIATVLAGEVDLYVSDSFEEKPVVGPSGQVVNYTVKSERPGDDSVFIQHNRFKPCTSEDGCYYIVGVFGKEYTKNQFTVVFKSEDSTITLQVM